MASIAVKATLAAARAKPAQVTLLAEKARLAAEAADNAADEAERVWSETAVK